MAVKVNYLNRDFEQIKQDLITYAKTYHPDKFQFLNDASPDVMYFEVLAYVSNSLQFSADRYFNESFRTTAQARESLVRIANDLGFFDIGGTPASVQVVLSIQVPAKNISGVLQPDPDYLLSIQSGMQVQSDNGVTFEILEEINFADERNRRVIPLLDANNAIPSAPDFGYTVEKYVKATAGVTKIQRFYVTEQLAKPFMTITLDDSDITSIEGIVGVAGVQFTAPADADFSDTTKGYFEVRSLLQETQFAELNPVPTTTQVLDSYIQPVVQIGQSVAIPKRFVVRRDVNDLVSITFGNNATSYTTYQSILNTAITDPNQISLNEVLNNAELGEIPAPNTTLFIKYRVGGGEKTNALAGQINTIGAKTYFPASASAVTSILNKVRGTFAVKNIIPALGGKEIPSVEELRAKAGKIFAAQDRIVTYEDLVALIDTMPAQFGKPFRVSYEEIKPRVANLQQVENGVNTLLQTLLLETTNVGRKLKAQDITTFLSSLRTSPTVVDPNNPNGFLDLSTESSNILNAAISVGNTLWIGEKARLYVIGRSESGSLLTAFKDTNGIWLSPNELLKTNLREFLKNKRVIGDWVDVVDGRVVNIQVEFTVMVDKANKQAVLVECLNKVRDYFNINNWQMNQPIFLANVQTILQEVQGVINVVDLKIYNIFGIGANSIDPTSGRSYTTQEIGRYRNNSTVAANINNNKFQMLAPNNVILGYRDTIFECKYPESDIIGSVI